MADFIELSATDLAAMLCSRVCHDLINPVGAIGNGLEVLADPNQGAMAEGAQELIANSAKHARAKLEFARLAYGASSTAGTDFDTRECERVARLLFEIEKADLDWQVPLILLPKHKAKLLMNMLLIAAMAVPRGGMVKVEVTGAAGAEMFRFTSTSDPEKRQKTLMPAGAEGLLSGAPGGRRRRARHPAVLYGHPGADDGHGAQDRHRERRLQLHGDAEGRGCRSVSTASVAFR